MKRSARTTTVAAGLALGLALAGCGSDSEEGTASSATGAANSKPTGTPIKLFTIQQITVTNQDATDEAADALKASVARINAEGGILGRPVEVEVCDDKFSPATAAECARKASSGDYAAVVGAVTQQGDAIYPVLEAAGMCNVGPNAINRLDYSSKASFPIVASGPANVAGYAYALKAVGSTNIGIAYVDIPTAAGTTSFVELGAKNAGGLKVNQKVPIPLTTTDISAVVASTLRGNDGVALVVAPAQLASFARSLGQSGSKVYAAASAADPKLIDQLGPAAERLVIAAAFAPVTGDAEGVKRFNADMDKTAPKAERNAFAINAWLAAQVLKQAIEQAKPATVDKTSVCAAMNSAKDVDMFGVLPKWSGAETVKIPGLNRLLSPYTQVQKVENGKLVVVDGKWVNALDPTATVPAV